MRISDKDRIAARAEKERKRKMPAKSAERLRDLAEERRRDADAEERFVCDFVNLDKDGWTLRKVLERVSRPAAEAQMTREQVESYYDRRALKLRRNLANGCRVTASHDVPFLAELTPTEEGLSDDQFYTLMTTDWPEVAR